MAQHEPHDGVAQTACAVVQEYGSRLVRHMLPINHTNKPAAMAT
jgi:hypothetical protein